MIIFVCASAVILLIMFFEKSLTKAASAASHCLVACTIKLWNSCRSKETKQGDLERDYGFVYSDDVYKEIDFSQLYKEYVKVKKERQKYKLLKSKGRFTPQQLKKYVDKYIAIIERNEREIYERLRDLTEAHIDRIEEAEPDMMSTEERIKTVLEYYQQATDKDNALRSTLFIDDYMHGRMINSIQSYDLMDNTKYKEIDELLLIMKETFGYNEEIQGLIKTSLTEANFMLAKRSVDLRALMDHQAPHVNFDADEQSIKSAEPMMRENSDVWNDKGNMSRNASIKYGTSNGGKALNKTMDH
jgi:hypothetical protein